jgi:inner membrane protein
VDSLTQAALGALCGELVLARSLGNRAIVHGLVLGLLPDLDIALNPWLDGVERLAWHRGPSHSLLFCVAGAPAFGGLLRRLHGPELSLARATWFAFLALATHVLIDCFTIYGTQVLQPFAATRVAWNNLSIVDPLFTAPLLLALLVAPWLDPRSRLRFRLGALGAGLAAAYALASFGLKAIADGCFERAMARDGIVAGRWISAPMPLTTLYWRCVADQGDAFRIGHAAVLDGEAEAVWRLVPRGRELVAGLEGTRAIRALDWFSDGYWAARRGEGGEVLLFDLRFGDRLFGRLPAPGEEPVWAFEFELVGDGADLRLRPFEPGDLGAALAHLASRAFALDPPAAAGPRGH